MYDIKRERETKFSTRERVFGSNKQQQSTCRLTQFIFQMCYMETRTEWGNMWNSNRKWRRHGEITACVLCQMDPSRSVTVQHLTLGWVCSGRPPLAAHTTPSNAPSLWKFWETFTWAHCTFVITFHLREISVGLYQVFWQSLFVISFIVNNAGGSVSLVMSFILVILLCVDVLSTVTVC